MIWLSLKRQSALRTAVIGDECICDMWYNMAVWQHLIGLKSREPSYSAVHGRVNINPRHSRKHGTSYSTASWLDTNKRRGLRRAQTKHYSWVLWNESVRHMHNPTESSSWSESTESSVSLTTWAALCSGALLVAGSIVLSSGRSNRDAITLR